MSAEIAKVCGRITAFNLSGKSKYREIAATQKAAGKAMTSRELVFSTKLMDECLSNPQGDHRRRPMSVFLALACVVLFSGCSHLGPKTVPVDRFDYSASISDSWKKQTLLNIVKMRYMDLPVFVDVSSIVAGYSMQTGVNINGTISSQNAVQGNFLSGGGQAVYTDRPTITYTPLTGEKFLRGLITPIDPKNIFFMLQAGYPADFLLALTVESLNGVRNRSTAGGMVREADPAFVRAMQLLRELQADGAVGMRVEENKTRNQTGVLFFRRDDVAPETEQKAAEVRRLLKMPMDVNQFTLKYSPVRGADDELAVSSRSMLQIMMAFASYLNVPDEHIRAHVALPNFEGANATNKQDVVRIYSSKSKPANAFASVFYRDHWFWIDDGDWKTKRALTAVMFFFTLAETGEPEKLPLITIPAQ